MTNTELIELLREARRWVGHNLDCTTVCDECVVAARIDAALAAHEAEERVDSATPVVEWVHREGSRIWSGGLGNAMFDVVLQDDGWKWVVVRERESGVCNTLDEAQRAAIAAARGLK